VPDVTGSGGWQRVRGLLRGPNTRSGRHRAALVAAAMVTAGTVACGSGGGGVPTLTWYTNPDNGGQEALADTCTEAANGRYRIEVTPLPTDANGQREQLVRRLAANDSSIDLMSLDPVFVPEFAAAGFLRPFSEREASRLTEDVLDGPLESAMWDGQLVVAPFWANTQLLWYKRSVAEQADIDPSTDEVTWDQIIDAAEQSDTRVEVTGARYEGYMVLVNTLVASGGGQILEHPARGRDATPDLDSPAGRQAAEILRTLGRSSAADPDVDTAIEENARAGFQADSGGFMINWPYVYAAAQASVDDGSLSQEAFDDIAWARVPRVAEGEPSAPALGGINLGVGDFTDHPDEAVAAAECITSTESQTEYMLAEGNPAARSAVFDDPEITEAFPMASLIRTSIDEASPRPRTAYYVDVSAAVQRTFHPPSAVNPDSTPAAADDLIVGVLHDEQLL
jgi:multiple sugar transport system substrate-binding protein